MVGGLGQVVVNVTDTIVLGRLNEVALGASAIGGLFLASFLMISYGFSSGMQLLVARKVGEENHTDVGKIFQNASFLNLLFALMVMIIFLPGVSFFAKIFIASCEIREAATTFVFIRLLGLPLAFGVALFRGFFSGIAKTSIISVAIGTMALLNLVLNYLLVFGHYGFPRLEVAGSAIASVISELVAVVIYVVYSIKNKKLEKYYLTRKFKIEKETILSLLQISLPLMLQFFIAIGSWFIFFLMVEKLGERPLAVSNLVRNVYMILMIPVLAFSNTTHTVVSNLFGASKVSEILPTVRKIVLLNLIATVMLVLINLINPTVSLFFFSNLNDVVQASIGTVYIISCSIFFFGIANAALSTIAGLGKTNVTLAIEIITLITYFGFTYVAIYIFQWPLEAIWCNEFVYFITMLLAALLYLWRYFSKTKSTLA